MGVSNGSQILYKIERLSFAQFCSIATARAEQAGRKGKPAIALDFSWLCFKLWCKSSVSETKKKFSSLVSLLISQGFFVYIVMDPSHRHHSKKATIVRDVRRDRSIIDAIRFKAQILSISKTLRLETYSTTTEKKQLLDKRKDLEKKVKTCESISQSRLSPDFREELENTARDLELQFSPQLLVIMHGPFQADSTVQWLLTQKKVDFALGNDSDFSFVAGPACLQVSDFKIYSVKKARQQQDDRQFQIDSISIESGFKEPISDCCMTIGLAMA